MAEDRRVRKTKKAICDVFCELTKDKKLNEITIKESKRDAANGTEVRTCCDRHDHE